MKARQVSILLAFGTPMLFLIGLTGCSRKAVQVPAGPTTSPAATTPEAASSTVPSSPSAPTSSVTEGDLVPALFSFDSFSLSQAARTALDRNAKLLREQPDIRIAIEGHCDERGTVEYNQSLGERRAHAAREYLTSAGVARTRIQVVSFGKERPFDEGHDEAAWATNRRAHFVVQ